MSSLNLNQFGQSEADRSIASMRAQVEGARTAMAAGGLSGVAQHFDKINADREAASTPTKPGFYRKDGPGYVPGRTSTEYQYQVPNEEHPKHRSHLEMRVHHDKPSASYNYTYGRHDATPEYDEPTPAQAGHMARTHSWIDPARKDSLEAIATGEPKLFGSSYKPGRSEVYSLYGTKRGSAHVGTMLGIAARDTAIEHGRTLTSPADLSPYSSRIVKNLKGKGVVDTGAPDDITNDSVHYGEPEYTRVGEDYRIPDAEVAAGRSTMRSVLREGRPRKQRETYTQERLF